MIIDGSTFFKVDVKDLKSLTEGISATVPL